MKLPVIAGFIFPNGERIETAGIGYCKMALKYIVDNNLLKQYEEANIAEDDFLIEYLGCVKIAMYRGKKYIFIPQIVNWYIAQITKVYKDSGYKVIACYKTFYTLDNNHKEYDYCTGCFSYNQLVIPKVLKNGKVIFQYNPKRIGD